jgi:signal peptide peptidase SppA
MRPSYVLQAFVETPWAILPHKLAILEEIVTRHAAGEKLDAEEVQSRIHGAKRPAERRAGSVAVLPLFGTIFPRANLMTDVSGATSAERFGAQFDELVSDPEIGAIILDVDSPGGQVNGIEELSRKIYQARGRKPIVAVANHTMASAAYWIGTAADEVVVTPSGEVGSIGVFAVHKDLSKAYEMEGIKISMISRGKYKTEGNPYEPLAEEARAAIQVRVDESYAAFVETVARNRGVKPSAVRNGFGEGRVVGARQAVELGMADRIGTLEETIARLLIDGGDTGGTGRINEDVPEAAEPSEPQLTDDMIREAQILSDRVSTILRKEQHNA